MIKSRLLVLGLMFFVPLALPPANCAMAANSSAALTQASLQVLVSSLQSEDQGDARQSWKRLVDIAKPEDLPLILSGMNDDPLQQNWIRGAADAVAERELANSGTLPKESLEKFVLDDRKHPRARRVAYEWLLKVDETASSRLLPKMLDDVSLELRYDAIASLLAEAENSADGAKLEKYQRAFQSARDKSQFQQAADALKALGQTPDMARQLGFLTKWKVVGPFDNLQRKGFNTIHLSAKTVDLDAEYDGKDGKVTWKGATAELQEFDSLGTVDFNKAFVEAKSLLGYAHTTFVAAEEQPVEIRYESKSATKLWVNGEEVAVKNVYHSGGGFDQYIVPVKLKAGANEILIKVCQNEQTQPWTKPWEFRLRVTDSQGGAIKSGW